jgi:hypothetical protein
MPEPRRVSPRFDSIARQRIQRLRLRGCTARLTWQLVELHQNTRFACRRNVLRQQAQRGLHLSDRISRSRGFEGLTGGRQGIAHALVRVAGGGEVKGEIGEPTRAVDVAQRLEGIADRRVQLTLPRVTKLP